MASSIHNPATSPRPNEGMNKKNNIKTSQNMGTSHTEKHSVEADQNWLKQNNNNNNNNDNENHYNKGMKE